MRPNCQFVTMNGIETTVPNGAYAHGSTLHNPLNLHINGRDVPSETGKTFDVSNPLTGETLYKCAAAGTGDYEPAIQKHIRHSSRGL
jgi:hypothetical protein